MFVNYILYLVHSVMVLAPCYFIFVSETIVKINQLWFLTVYLNIFLMRVIEYLNCFMLFDLFIFMSQYSSLFFLDFFWRS